VTHWTAPLEGSLEPHIGRLAGKEDCERLIEEKDTSQIHQRVAAPGWDLETLGDMPGVSPGWGLDTLDGAFGKQLVLYTIIVVPPPSHYSSYRRAPPLITVLTIIKKHFWTSS